MAREGGFFSPNRKVSGKDKQVASSMSAGSYGGFVDAGERRGFVSAEQAKSMLLILSDLKCVQVKLDI